MQKFFLIQEGKSIGPFTIEKLRTKKIMPDTYVCHEGIEYWKPVAEFPEL